MTQNQFNLSEIDQMLDSLAAQNWAVSSSLFSQEICSLLAQECQKMSHEGKLQRAAIGSGPSKTLNSEIRGDLTSWLDLHSKNPTQIKVIEFLSELQELLNKNFFLNLKHFEAHFALYPEGTGYQKHTDNPWGRNPRKITFILYLNEFWKKGYGGELNLYSPHDENELICQLEPKIGQFILFRSELFPHQVEINHQPRMSFTGWFRDDAL